MDDSPLWGPLELVLATCTLVILVSYLLVRLGHFRVGLGLYIVATTVFPLAAPSAGHSTHEMGLVVTAILPVLIAAIFLSRDLVVFVALAISGIAVTELSLLPLSAVEAMEGFAITLIVLASSGLMLVLRTHQRQIEAMRTNRLRESEAALGVSEDRLFALAGTSRDLASGYLASAGYKVLVARHGGEAWALASERKDAIHLRVTGDAHPVHLRLHRRHSFPPWSACRRG